MAMLQLNTVTCHATDDSVGSDELVGVMGPARFSIGRFADGESKNLGLQQIVPAGVGTLQIIEKEAVGSNDLLASIDLMKDIDTDRVHSIMQGRARYVINFKVTSV